MSRSFSVNGVAYFFNKEEFLLWYNCLGNERGQKMAFQREMVKRCNVSENTVKGWVRKNGSPPGSLDAIRILECYFNVSENSFLKPVHALPSSEEKPQMRPIPDYERATARKLYGEICDLIDSVKYIDDELRGILYGKINKESFKGLLDNPRNRTDKEYQREQKLLTVRKARFDIPDSICNKLNELINEIYGPWDYDDREMYFASEAYKIYLEKNAIQDTIDSRYLYSDLFIHKCYCQLDCIFKDYITKEVCEL